MKEINFYEILKDVSELELVTPDIFEQIMKTYNLTTNDFKKMENNEKEKQRVSDILRTKLFKKKSKEYHTISSSEDFLDLKKSSTNNRNHNTLVYHPLNDHSRVYLSAGDILFSYQTGSFGGLSNSLNKRGIYGVGLALSDPIKFMDNNEKEYQNLGVVVIYPYLIENHLSVKNIQLNPNTIDLMPYNGNRNDALQHMGSQTHINKILGMILTENKDINEFYKELELTIIPETLATTVWDDFWNKNKNKNYKKKFLEWAKNTVISEGELELKTVNNYISGLNSMEREWNIENPLNPIEIWEAPYHARDDIGFDVVINSKAVKKLNKNQNRTQFSALNLYKRFLEIPKRTLINKGKNKIYFGAPGTGKSYGIKEFIKRNGISDYEDNVDNPNVYRVTMHPEFTYSDFVGQVMPDVTTKGEDNEKTQIIYKFVPQVFTMALKRAINTPNEPVFLVLEEMSRSNVAAVFGDLFQLLDRDEEGESEYRINNSLITREIYGNISTKKIYLPNNLFLVGTVNTSDQNVFVMDTAFKRRFEYHYVNAQNVAKDKEDKPLNNVSFLFKEKQNEISFTWIDLYLNLNKFITKKIEEGGLGLTEDKQIGQFFIKFRINDEEYNYNQFKGKLIHYLWDDVQKIAFTDNTLFKRSISSFSELFTQVEDKKNIFSDALLNQMKINLDSLEVDVVDE